MFAIETNSRRLLFAFIVLCLLLSLAGSQRELSSFIVDPPVSLGEEEVKPATRFLNPLPMPEKPDQSAYHLDTQLYKLALEKKEMNEDTVGWLQVPGTSISQEVMFHPDPADKFYYLRRGFDRRESNEGSYFIDYRATFGETREGLPENTVIYGHSMEDDENYPLFSQLKKFRKPVFAAETPYIYFSTTGEDMAWEIFAVFISTTRFLYNVPNPTPEAYQDILDGSRGRSLYTYEDVEVGTEDKIITLSTCIYNHNGQYLGYPNKYRYVVMAKLVPAEEPLRDRVAIVTNEEIMAP